MGSNFILILLVCLQAGFVAGQVGSFVPVFDDVTALDNRFLLENFTVGNVVGTIKATDGDGTQISFYSEGDGAEYFAIGRTSGVVTLQKRLEFDTVAADREIVTQIRIVDGNQQENVFVGKVFIEDVNDVPPEFDRYDIFEEIREDAAPGLLVASISVTDEDTTNEILSVECLAENDLFLDACDKFEVQFTPADISNKDWVGQLRLKKSLDYEQRISFAILLVAKDGVFETSNEIHIEVIDINDSPPIWTRVLPVTINEEITPGTPITTVTATDGDATDPRAIFYEIIDTTYPDGVKFEINNLTGVITNMNRMDYDDPDHRKGTPYEVKLRAREIISSNPLDLGNDAVTTSTTVVIITIQDIDDNAPTFNQPTYTATIPENVVNGGNIPGLQMTITDIDSGILNSFDLVSLNFQDIFSIAPTEGQANAGATIFIKDNSKIDYESGVTEYVIRVEARENQAPVPLTGSAVVTINVLNINDQSPEFPAAPNDAFFTSVRETEVEGFQIIDLDAVDSEAGNFGTAGIRYQLFGNQLNHFQINEITGALTVAQCNLPGAPGLYPCIDYERKRQYVLTVSATDDLGRGRSKSVQVIVSVIDENDNVPKPKTRYTASIYEEQTEPVQPLIIKAEDPDTVGKDIRYTLSGKSEVISNWQIENTVDADDGERIGIITARTPAKFSWAENALTGAVNFEVITADQKDTVRSQVTIFIIDINNNSPEFSDSVYEISIPEDTQGDTFVITVTASDGDAPTTGNGILDFTIASGSLGKFTVKSSQAVGSSYEAQVYTNPDATFNYDQVKTFNMLLVARDQGSPTTRSGTATLIVNLIDINNNDPEITPTSVSKTVAEDRPPNSQVHRVIAVDPDMTADLRYYMTPTRAQTPTGADVDKNVYDFTQLFRIEEMTGIVRVNRPLNRELTSFIVNNLRVVDVGATPAQTGTGALFITITEVNDQDPVFDQPFYNITIDEELNINFFVRNLHCTDEDDEISSYVLTQTQPRTPQFFTLQESSGSLIIADRIDFERLEEIRLVARCFDDGLPSRSGTTDVFINVRNINDNFPVFDKPLYTAAIDETMEGQDIGGTVITTVTATDIDKGDFGIVRYSISDPDDRFEIDNEQGITTVKSGTTFDREKDASINFQVIAYDSPNTPDKRKSTTVPVYITIRDLNDNCPEFNANTYKGSIPESAKPGTDVIDTLATDKDFGINRQIVYSIEPGSFRPLGSEGYFNVNGKSGRVFTQTILSGKFGVYTFNVTATDTSGTLPNIMCSSNVPAEVTVSQSQNYAPRWVDPPQRDWVIYILESQYEGMLVYDSHAEDPDPGRSGVVDYYFVEGANHVHATNEFRINQVTGVIRAEIEFDREQVDRYFLTLVAVDQGATTASSETTLIVKIRDVDDNDPIFPSQDGVVVPLSLPADAPLSESEPIPAGGKVVGKCEASDADSDHENNKIYYEILSNDDDALSQMVSVDLNDCTITLLKQLDYDTTPQLEFNIYAFNKKSDDSVKRDKRDVSLSILPVTIKIEDVNDNPPTFTASEYFACAPLTSPLQSQIVDIDAHDVEQEDEELTYSIKDTNRFIINAQGIVQNTVSFPSISQRVFSFTAAVNDGVNEATSRVNIFVTTPGNQIKMTVNRPSSDVKRVQNEYEETIRAAISGARYACAVVEPHIDDDGNLDPQKSDVLMSVVTFNQGANSYEFISGSRVNELIAADKISYANKYDAYSIATVSIVEDDDLGLDEDVVLAILIVTIILIVLSLLLMILACYCIWAKTKKKKKRVKAERSVHRLAGDGGKEESFSNPVYNNAGYVAYEDEYSTVVKSKKEPMPISPVVIPAPENLEPLSTFAPTNLQPADDNEDAIPPEIPEPVIETEVMPNEPESHPTTIQHTQLEYEDVIETMVQDEDDLPLPSPPPLDADDIETEIHADSPEPSPRN